MEPDLIKLPDGYAIDYTPYDMGEIDQFIESNNDIMILSENPRTSFF